MHTEQHLHRGNRLNVAQQLRRWLRVPAVRRQGRKSSRPVRQPMVVEAMEPRYLLSAEGLLPPPNPDEHNTWVLQAPITTAEEVLLSQFAAQQTVEAPAARHAINELIFIDAGVSDHESLVAEVLAFRSTLDPDQATRAEIVVLDAFSDGVEQISRWLAQYQDLRAVHIVSHGDAGVVRLGNVLLDADNVEQHGARLSDWGKALLAGGDILIYGCDVGQGERGDRLLEALTRFTAADVAASTTPTG
ncbi:MAG: DUF4347 domain-containing protein, partial [Parazoarcus communis]